MEIHLEKNSLNEVLEVRSWSVFKRIIMSLWSIITNISVRLLQVFWLITSRDTKRWVWNTEEQLASVFREYLAFQSSHNIWSCQVLSWPPVEDFGHLDSDEQYSTLMMTPGASGHPGVRRDPCVRISDTISHISMVERGRIRPHVPLERHGKSRGNSSAGIERSY